MTLKEFCIKQGWVIGFAEVRRAISSNAITVNGVVAYDADMIMQNGDIVTFGKKREAVYGPATSTAR